jgi:hypothetical protein
MADKTLKITFSGICTLWPGPPRNGEKPDKAFVIMPSNPQPDPKTLQRYSEFGARLPEHFPFVHVAASALVNPLPNPPLPDAAFTCGGGEHFVYLFPDARVVIDPAPRPGTPIIYYTDPKGRPIGERPGSDDVAQQDDIRWLADIRDVLPDLQPQLKPAANPTGANIGKEVSAVVNLDGGTLKANFPGDSVNPKTFVDKNGEPAPGLRRVLADEFTIEIPYPEETTQITLIFENLRKGADDRLPEKKLMLRWRENKTTLELRMGNDPIDEVSKLDREDRFDPVKMIGPVLKPRDDDFDLHYNLLDIPPGARFLPQNDIQQCSAEGCKPKTG